MDGREKEREEGKEVPEWAIFGDPGQAEQSPISHLRPGSEGLARCFPFMTREECQEPAPPILETSQHPSLWSHPSIYHPSIHHPTTIHHVSSIYYPSSTYLSIIQLLSILHLSAVHHLSSIHSSISIHPPSIHHPFTIHSPSSHP